MSILFEVYLHKLGFLFALKCFWIKVDLLNTNDMFSAIRAEKEENQAIVREMTRDKFARTRVTRRMSHIYHMKFKNLHFSQETLLEKRFTLSLRNARML